MKLRGYLGFWCLILVVSLVQVPLVKAADELAGEKDLTRVRKKVEALRAWELTEALNLDEDTSSRLFPAMREADQERWRIESRNRDLVREMSKYLERRNPDPRAINRVLDELQSNRRELNQVEERHLERVRQILSPIDTARYLMFQIKFQREIRRKMAEAMKERRQIDGEPAQRTRDRMNDRNSPDSDSGSDSGGGRGGNGGGGRR